MIFRMTSAGLAGIRNAAGFKALLLAALVSPAGAMASDELAPGLKAYNSQRYGQALRLLQPVAAKGDVQAQELVGMMYWYGPRHYGSEVPRDAYRSLDMLDKAAAGGSEPALLMLKTMSTRTLINAGAGVQEEPDD
jgi:TPR repeat protein